MVGGFSMLPIIGATALVLFIILWKSGILDDLVERSRIRQDASRRRIKKELGRQSEDTEMAKRLEVFEEFIEELPDEED
jgi:hypothetical protein